MKPIKADKRYRCEYPGVTCDRTFARTNDRKIHYQVDHEGETYECNVCQKRFKQRRHLDDHMPQHTGQWKFKCDKCDYGTKSAERLAAHKRKHDGDEPFPLKDDDKFSCSVCRATFTSKKRFRDHTYRTDCKRYVQFACPVSGCTAGHRSLRAVKNHIATAHPTVNKKDAVNAVKQQIADYEAKCKITQIIHVNCVRNCNNIHK